MRHMAMRTAVPDASIDQCPAGPEHDRTRPGGGAGGQTGSAATKGSSVPNQATSTSMASAADASLIRLLRMADSAETEDRKGVGRGQSVALRSASGGRGNLKKKNQNYK